MFLQNKYTTTYYKIIAQAKLRNVTSGKYQIHHIVPKSLGGSDSNDNLVSLTYREHRICHRLLIKMLEGPNKHKMMYAYKLFDPSYDSKDLPNPHIYRKPEHFIQAVKTRKRRGSYKTGSENIFASAKVKSIVSERMKNNNPMKRPENILRMRENNPNTISITFDQIIFPSYNAAARHFLTTRHIIQKAVTENIHPLTAKELYQKKIILPTNS